MSDQPSLDALPKVVYLTAGAAGMFCGSCMHDNTLAVALQRLGVDVQLISTYTPIRTDEDDVSEDRVFFGGINVYLEQRASIFRWLPSWFDRFLSKPAIIRWATSGGIQTDLSVLGAMTVSMLQGKDGNQRKEVDQLCKWLVRESPNVVNLTNMLIAGCVPEIKRAVGCAIVVTLQGDDIFLESLPEPYRSDCLREIHRLVEYVDAFVVPSQYYGEFMQQYFKVPADRLHHVPLGIECSDFDESYRLRTSREGNGRRSIGYLARLAPEKGFHLLVDAFIKLRQQHRVDARLDIAGWLGKDRTDYAEQQFAKLRLLGDDAFTYHGAIDRKGKVEFLSKIDVLSVPTIYREPKGLYTLEALASGVPIVQPNHGAFAEIVRETKGGVLVQPEDTDALASELARLTGRPDELRSLGEAGRESVKRTRNSQAMAEATLKVYRQCITSQSGLRD